MTTYPIKALLLHRSLLPIKIATSKLPKKFLREISARPQKFHKKSTLRYLQSAFLILPRYYVIHDGRALVAWAVEMGKCLKPALLVTDGHERLAVNDGCTRLDTVVFPKIDLIHVNLLLIGRQVFDILVFNNRRNDRRICLFPRRPWQCLDLY